MGLSTCLGQVGGCDADRSPHPYTRVLLFSAAQAREDANFGSRSDGHSPGSSLPLTIQLQQDNAMATSKCL